MVCVIALVYNILMSYPITSIIDPTSQQYRWYFIKPCLRFSVFYSCVIGIQSPRIRRQKLEDFSLVRSLGRHVHNSAQVITKQNSSP